MSVIGKASLFAWVTVFLLGAATASASTWRVRSQMTRVPPRAKQYHHPGHRHPHVPPTFRYRKGIVPNMQQPVPMEVYESAPMEVYQPAEAEPVPPAGVDTIQPIPSNIP